MLLHLLSCLSSRCVQWRFSWDRGIKGAIQLTYLVAYQPDWSQRQCYKAWKGTSFCIGRDLLFQETLITSMVINLPTWMLCFVTFEMPLIYLLTWDNICMGECLWHVCSITQAFLSSYEMKEIQLSHTNLSQPFHSTDVNFWFGCNRSFCLLDLCFVLLGLLTWMMLHTCKLKQAFFWGGFSEALFGLSIWSQHPCRASKQGTISRSHFKSLYVNDVVPVT